MMSNLPKPSGDWKGYSSVSNNKIHYLIHEVQGYYALYTFQEYNSGEVQINRFDLEGGNWIEIGPAIDCWTLEEARTKYRELIKAGWQVTNEHEQSNLPH
jgi:hypothetical protein